MHKNKFTPIFMHKSKKTELQKSPTKLNNFNRKNHKYKIKFNDKISKKNDTTILKKVLIITNIIIKINIF